MALKNRDLHNFGGSAMGRCLRLDRGFGGGGFPALASVEIFRKSEAEIGRRIRRLCSGKEPARCPGGSRGG